MGWIDINDIEPSPLVYVPIDGIRLVVDIYVFHIICHTCVMAEEEKGPHIVVHN